jgi:hypothetical protein
MNNVLNLMPNLKTLCLEGDSNVDTDSEETLEISLKNLVKLELFKLTVTNISIFNCPKLARITILNGNTCNLVVQDSPRVKILKLDGIPIPTIAEIVQNLPSLVCLQLLYPFESILHHINGRYLLFQCGNLEYINANSIENQYDLSLQFLDHVDFIFQQMDELDMVRILVINCT